MYTNAVPLVCIRFAVECENGSATVAGTLVTSACQAGMSCWQANVSGCSGSAAKVSFFKDADNLGDPTCHSLFPGTEGTLVASCEIGLVSTDG